MEIFYFFLSSTRQNAAKTLNPTSPIMHLSGIFQYGRFLPPTCPTLSFHPVAWQYKTTSEVVICTISVRTKTESKHNTKARYVAASPLPTTHNHTRDVHRFKTLYLIMLSDGSHQYWIWGSYHTEFDPWLLQLALTHTRRVSHVAWCLKSPGSSNTDRLGWQIRSGPSSEIRMWRLWDETGHQQSLSRTLHLVTLWPRSD